MLAHTSLHGSSALSEAVSVPREVLNQNTYSQRNFKQFTFSFLACENAQNLAKRLYFSVTGLAEINRFTYE